MSAAWNKRLAKASALHKEGKVIWWRRGPFHGDYREQVPKWHIFADRKPGEPSEPSGNVYEFIWEAKCGYTRTFMEVIMEQFPQLNLSKTAPPKAERCIKCLQQELRRVK